MTCDRSDAQRACWQRIRAVREGTLCFAWNGGWRYLRPVSQKWERVLRCPWCEGTLPTIEDAVNRLRESSLDAWEGDDE